MTADVRLAIAEGAPAPAVGGPGAARPETPEVGFYLHVPFCVARCHYCSFATAPLEAEAERARYVDTLRAELRMLAGLPWARDVRVVTVFVGGGTPSLLPPEEMAAVLDAVRAGFAVVPGAEVTVECNPESVDRAKLAAYRAAGVNRVSLGVQSLDDAVLARLGRLHDGRGARAAFEAARDAGFDNVSVDLMYGLPRLTVERWAADVATVLAWAPDHLSAYGLTLDGGSRWAATGVEDLPGEDTVVGQYWALARAAAEGGFEHYEISNYARPGRRSIHNQIYWRAGEYLGAGVSACGFVGDLRYGNARAVARYRALVDAGAPPVETSERLGRRQRLGERLILGLRTADGIERHWLDQRLAGAPSLRRRVADWQARGWLQELGERVRLSEAGFLVSDAMFVELV